jgi:hypothetical protein
VSPAALLARAGEFGYAVRLSDSGPCLVAVVEGAILPRGFVTDLKANRDAIVRLLSCAVCGRDCSDAENRERLKSPAFCDRACCPHKERP